MLQPLTETALTDRIRQPVNGIVVRNKLFLYISHLDEPGLTSIINQWSIATPAMWIAMLKLWSLEELTAVTEIFKNHWVSILYEYAFPISLSSQITLSIYILYKIHIIVTANAGIILTESRCSMNDTSTIRGGYIIIAHYIEALLAEVLCIWIKRLILTLFKRSTLELFNDFILNRLLGFLIYHASKYGFYQSFCHDKVFAIIENLYIIYVGIYNKT